MAKGSGLPPMCWDSRYFPDLPEVPFGTDTAPVVIPGLRRRPVGPMQQKIAPFEMSNVRYGVSGL
jgi:hypothetical protein